MALSSLILIYPAGSMCAACDWLICEDDDNDDDKTNRGACVKRNENLFFWFFFNHFLSVLYLFYNFGVVGIFVLIFRYFFADFRPRTRVGQFVRSFVSFHGC